MVRFNNVVMSGAMRKISNSAKGAIKPVVFALMLPMCSPAIALPRKETQHDIKKIESESYDIYVMFRSGFGKMIRELCQYGKFQSLRIISNNPHNKRGMAFGLEISILRKGNILDKPGRFDLVLGSLFQNSHNLAKLFRSDKPTYDRYMAEISTLGFPLLKGKVEQWIKNGARDDVILLKELVSCKP